MHFKEQSARTAAYIASFKIREESSTPCRRKANRAPSLGALQLLALFLRALLLTELNFDASAPRGFFLFFLKNVFS